MGKPIEIEFAVNLNPSTNQHLFYLLQIRPIVDNQEMLHENLDEIPEQDTIISAHNALGHGITKDVVDVVYIKTETTLKIVTSTFMFSISRGITIS